jgi:hypothetical protein
LVTVPTTATTCFPRTTRLLSSLTRNGKESGTDIRRSFVDSRKRIARGELIAEGPNSRGGSVGFANCTAAVRLTALHSDPKNHAGAAESLCESARHSHSVSTRGSGPKGEDPEDITIENVRNQKVRWGRNDNDKLCDGYILTISQFTIGSTMPTRHIGDISIQLPPTKRILRTTDYLNGMKTKDSDSAAASRRWADLWGLLKRANRFDRTSDQLRERYRT